jgi:aerobic carbon-monoxide dehydrogenase medium subunit
MQLVPSAGYIPTSFRTLPRLSVSRPATIADAVKALVGEERPAVLAGGTDLPARFNEGFAPTGLVDISRIDALRTVAVEGTALTIGAAVTHAEGSTHELIGRSLPSFAKAWARIANVRIRFSATLGGNLMARRTRYEGSILLSALGARVRLRTMDGETELPVEALWTTDLTARALLTAIVIPLREDLRLDYARDLRPIMTQALVLEHSGPARLVIGTEHIMPKVVTLPQTEDGAAIWRDIDFADPVTSSSYLRKASAALLSRQLERMRLA